jgi:hypothetical protein
MQQEIKDYVVVAKVTPKNHSGNTPTFTDFLVCSSKRARLESGHNRALEKNRSLPE